MSACRKCLTSKSREDERYENAFYKLAGENADAIPLRDMRTVLDKASLDNELDSDQKHLLLSRADSNGDGYIDMNEFIKLVRQPISADGTLLEKALFKAADLVTPINQKRRVYSYLKEYSCRPPPIFIILISVIQISIFLYYACTDGLTPGWLYGCPGCTVGGIIGPLVFHPLWKKQIWRYVSYMFVHAGIEHLAGNIITQLILGVPLELVHKMWRIGPLYIAGVLMGSLLQSAVDPYVVLVGASGGCYALLAAHLANLILNWSEMPWRWVRLSVITLFVGMDVSFAVYRRYYLDECDRVSYMAHAGGAVAGLLLGIVILKNLRVLNWEKALWWVCLVVFIALSLICIVLNILYNPGDRAIFSLRCTPKN